jgi:hypothetical protein
VQKKLERTASEKTDRRPNSGSSDPHPTINKNSLRKFLFLEQKKRLYMEGMFFSSKNNSKSFEKKQLLSYNWTFGEANNVPSDAENFNSISQVGSKKFFQKIENFDTNFCTNFWGHKAGRM